MKTNNIEETCQSDDSSDNIDYSLVPHLLCPFCKVNVPLIQQIYIDRETMNPFITISCKCIHENEIQTVSLEYFLNFLFSKPQCFKHKREASFFCKKCKIYLCSSCNNYHSLFKNDHLSNTIDLECRGGERLNEKNNKKEYNLMDFWNLTNQSKKINSIYNLEYHLSTVFANLQNYFNKEISVIEQMIVYFNQMKKMIEINNKKIIKTNSYLVNFLRVLYNDFYKVNQMNPNVCYENILNFQKINLNDTLILKCDNEFLDKLTSNCDKIMKAIHIQQKEIIKRQICHFQDKIENDNTVNNNSIFSSKQFLSTNDNTNPPTNNNYAPEKRINDRNRSLKIRIEKDNNKNKDNNCHEKNNNINDDKQDIFNLNSENFNQFFPASPSVTTIGLYELTKNDLSREYMSNSRQLKEELNIDKSFLGDCKEKYQKKSKPFVVDSLVENTNNLDENLEASFVLSPIHFEKREKVKCISSLLEHKDGIRSIIQLKNNPIQNINGQIITNGNDGLLLFIDPKTLKIISKSYLDITAFCELLDGRIAMGKADFSLQLYLVNKQQTSTELTGHTDIITSIAQNTSSTIITSSRDSTIKIWEINQMQCLKTLTDHFSAVNNILLLDGGTNFLSCSDDQTIVFWKNNVKAKEYAGHKGKVNDLCDISNNTFASCSEDKTIKIWDMTTNKQICTLEGHTEQVNKIIRQKVKPKDTVIISVSDDKSIRFWNVSKKTCITIIENSHSQKITTILEIDDGKIMTGSQDGLIKIWK